MPEEKSISKKKRKQTQEINVLTEFIFDNLLEQGIVATREDIAYVLYLERQFEHQLSPSTLP